MGGKGGDDITIGYKYFLGIHMILAHAVDAICKIKADQAMIWDAEVSENEQIYINQPGIFGEAEGGVQGYVDVEFGRFNQAANSYLTGRFGGLSTQTVSIPMPSEFFPWVIWTDVTVTTGSSGVTIPAFRGVTGLVLRGIYIGNNPYLRPWSVYVERCQTEGGWYPEKAAIMRAA